MWIPQTWHDIELAIGTLIETEELDFKQDLSPGKGLNDIAKDAAAMSLGGGVIVLGIAEQNGLARSITPVSLNDAADRIRQVLDARVTPSLWVDVKALTHHAEDTDGVVVVTIPASWSAPHQFDHRFPARSGATTRWLNGQEIETIFEQRAALQRDSGADIGMAGHAVPPSLRLEHLEHVGVLRTRLRPAAAVRHPEEPRLRRSLTQASLDAADNLARFLGRFTPKTFDFLASWEPAGPHGWKSGRFIASQQQIRGAGIVGGFFQYGHGFSFTTQISLLSGMEPDAPAGAIMAEEHHWAIELMAQMALAGAFYRHLSDAPLLRVDLDLGGLLGAVSFHAARGIAFDAQAPTVTENLYSAGEVFPTSELADDPRDPARRLLDPFMVALLEEGIDIVDWIAN